MEWPRCPWLTLDVSVYLVSATILGRVPGLLQPGRCNAALRSVRSTIKRVLRRRARGSVNLPVSRAPAISSSGSFVWPLGVPTWCGTGPASLEDRYHGGRNIKSSCGRDPRSCGRSLTRVRTTGVRGVGARVATLLPLLVPYWAVAPPHIAGNQNPADTSKSSVACCEWHEIIRSLPTPPSPPPPNLPCFWVFLTLSFSVSFSVCPSCSHRISRTASIRSR